MPGKITVKVKGTKELIAKLKTIDKKARDEAQLAALLSGGLLVVNDAKRRCPVRTGTLRRSIHIGGAADRVQGYSPAANTPQLRGPERRGSLLVIFIGSNVEYGPFVEFGTSRQQAKPFLRPALDGNKNAVRKEMADVLEEFIQKQAA